MIQRLSVPADRPPKDPTLASLWQSGVHPSAVREFHRNAAPLVGVAPGIVLGILASSDLAPDIADDPTSDLSPALVTWLAGARAALARIAPTTRLAWAKLGSTAPDTLCLSHAGYQPDDLITVAGVSRITGPAAVTVLASRVRAGHRPAIKEVVERIERETGALPTAPG